LQPIEIEICGGYSRHIRASGKGFANVSTTIGWVPLFKDTSVWISTAATAHKASRQGLFEWLKLSDDDQAALSRRLQSDIYTFVYESIGKAFDRIIYRFTYQGMRRVVFVLSSFKGDQPEKNRWCAGIGCQICVEPNLIILDSDVFRGFDMQGRVHDDGFQQLSLNKYLLPGDPWDVIKPPDFMHTFDNVSAVHMLRCYLVNRRSNRK
jgi:hypothetical protein